MRLGIQPKEEHFAIYTLIYVWKQYLQLLNWHKIVTYIILLTYFLENCLFDHKLAPLWCHMSSNWNTISLFDQIWRQGGKNINFQTFQRIGENLEMQSRLFKSPNFPSLLWIGKNLEIYTAPDQHFKIQMLNLWMSWENLCPNLSFTVENKMGNSHKRGWSHFKLNINDWDIPFPKSLRIYQWIWKSIFHWEKWNELIKLIRECVRLKNKIEILVAAKIL